VTTKTNYPLPRIDTCHDSLGRNRLFSSLNMSSGYWQVPVKDEDIHETCFVTIGKESLDSEYFRSGSVMHFHVSSIWST